MSIVSDLGRMGLAATVLSIVVTSKSGADDRRVETGPRFAVSAETTFITGPLTANGYVDYFAALNQRLGEGVTPQNNANVLFQQALGPAPGEVAPPPEFYKLMEMERPSPDGDCFVDLSIFLSDETVNEGDDAALSAAAKQLETAQLRPWSKAEFPVLAEWLKANERPLARIVDGTKRSRYFSPVCPSEDGPAFLIDVPRDSIIFLRSPARALAARAMLHAGAVRFEAARRDLLACHRLPRHIGTGPTLTDAIVAIAIETIAIQAELGLIEAWQPQSRAALDHMADISALPPLPDMAQIIDERQRLLFLDWAVGVERLGASKLATAPHAASNDLFAEALDQTVDWDAVLRRANRWFDRFAAAMRRETREERLDAIAEIEREWEEIQQEASQNAPTMMLRTKTRSRLAADILVALRRPPLAALQEAEDRTTQRLLNLQIALALAAYHADQGEYPGRLQELSPRYLAELPFDLFSGRPLIYRSEDKRYVLYSVGANGADDGGRTFTDEPAGDDLPVRMGRLTD